MPRCLTATTVVLAAIAWSAPGTTAMAAELGDRCVADSTVTDRTAIVINNSFNSGAELPVNVPPEGSKVITRWRVQAEPGLEPIAQQLVAFKQVEAEEDQKVGESALETIVGGANEFAARITVPEYGHIGLAGPDGTLLCAEEDRHLAGIVEGEWAIGETRHFETEIDLGVPVTATVEPDADHDGYGDESQDRCPQSAAFQSDCPPPVTLAVTAKARKRSILLRVTPSAEASVLVYGQVGWNFMPKPHAQAHASKQGTKRLIVGLDGGTKDVSPNATTRFTVNLPKTVKRRLSRITVRESVRAKLTLRATNAAGIGKNTRVRVTLRGWRPVG